MGKIIDLHNELTAINLYAGTATTSVNGAGVDLRGYHGVLKVMLNSGAGGAGASLAVKIQDSADNSTFADVQGLTFTTVGNTPSLQSIGVDTRAVRRYIRAVLTVGGTASFGCAITAIGQRKVV